MISPPLPPIEKAFLRLKKNLELNPSFDEIVQQKHKAVRDFLQNNGILTDTKLIGSLSPQKQTRIQPRQDNTFDIDILIILDEFIGWVPYGGITTYEAMEKLESTLRKSDRYRAMRPRQDQPTVVFEHANGIKIELVPAYIDKIGYSPTGIAHSPVGRGYWIPKNGGLWELADYDYDAGYISKMNAVSSGWLIPCIKMLKVIKRLWFNEDMISFHLEILATKIIPPRIITRKMLGLRITYPMLIESFFTDAQQMVLFPVKIPGSNSTFVKTEYPYTLKSRFKEIADYCKSIRTLSSINDRLKGWKKLFGDPFTLE